MAKKILTLDYSKWVTGGVGPNKVGTGDSTLVNDEGNMCVLGQFIPQISPKTTLECLRGYGSPADLNGPIPHLSKKDEDGDLTDTPLATRAMSINDAAVYKPEKRIELLKKLFAKAGFRIKVTNKPRKNATAKL